MGLNVSGVCKSFNGKQVVDHLSFSMDKPGVFGLLGTNGAGKTTTLRMILGILEKDEGTIDWNGQPVSRKSVRFGYLSEERGLYPKIRVGEQLQYFGQLRGMSSADVKKSIHYWLGRLRAQEYINRPAEQLSKGNQQKIQLISTILHDPELVILDEPFSGLDPVNVDLFQSVITELIEKGKYIILTSHQMAAVEEYCREILILHRGKTVKAGNLKDIKNSYGRTNLQIDCDGDIAQMAAAQGIAPGKVSATGTEFKITSDKQAYALLESIIQSGLRLDRFEIREPSLHEIFVELAGEQ